MHDTRRLIKRGIHLVEFDPADNPWINNSLATVPDGS